MTISEFQDLQVRAAASGTLKDFLRAEGVAYSTYNYWCKKTKTETTALPIAPISIRNDRQVTPESMAMSGVEHPGVRSEGALRAWQRGCADGGVDSKHVGSCSASKTRCAIICVREGRTSYLNSVIASMPYFEKATEDELRALLPHKWKEYHPEAIMTTPVRQLAK